MLDRLAFSIGYRAAGNQQGRGDRGGCDRRGQQGQEEVARAGQDARRETEPEEDQSQRIDGGVEKAEVELALGDELGGHSEAVQDPGTHSEAPIGAAGDERPPSQLRPRYARVHSLAPALGDEQTFGVDDRAPGDDEAHLGNRLEHQRTEQPRPADVLQAAERLFQGRNQLEHQIGDEQIGRQPQGRSLQMELREVQCPTRVVCLRQTVSR